jgi:putative Ca2+/H+ antiporter (TMEM165/GDT1 family)
VFTAALSALGLMTVLSAVLGHIAPTLLPKRLTTFAAALLFLFFGAKMLREGLEMDREAGVGEEMREVEQELEEKEHDLARRDRKLSNPHSLESGRRSPSPSKGSSHGAGSGGLTNLFSLLLSPAWVQTFIMTFLGEWGDRSQIATIAMAAGQDYWWVTLGAISGHAICTGLAVLGGRALAGKVSMRVGKFRSSFQPSVERYANKFLQSRSAAQVHSWCSACCTFGRRTLKTRSS